MTAEAGAPQPAAAARGEPSDAPPPRASGSRAKTSAATRGAPAAPRRRPCGGPPRAAGGERRRPRVGPPPPRAAVERGGRIQVRSCCLGTRKKRKVDAQRVTRDKSWSTFGLGKHG
ncbi:hypothetical protein PAHAL_1G235500 [Panicum hallii]|uniref:Uncharacterized protein n=1 Tax=Panicum hallii TaxID=206008 RepID=A0A2S3GNR2_9POAL|nr:hypothetical protein PAHAL_1G235500 [Panicum hallii]